MLTRSMESSSSAGLSLTTPKVQPRKSRFSLEASTLEGAGIASPSSSAASIQAAAPLRPGQALIQRVTRRAASRKIRHDDAKRGGWRAGLDYDREVHGTLIANCGPTPAKCHASDREHPGRHDAIRFFALVQHGSRSPLVAVSSFPRVWILAFADMTGGRRSLPPVRHSAPRRRIARPRMLVFASMTPVCASAPPSAAAPAMLCAA